MKRRTVNILERELTTRLRGGGGSYRGLAVQFEIVLQRPAVQRELVRQPFVVHD